MEIPRRPSAASCIPSFLGRREPLITTPGTGSRALRVVAPHRDAPACLVKRTAAAEMMPSNGSRGAAALGVDCITACGNSGHSAERQYPRGHEQRTHQSRAANEMATCRAKIAHLGDAPGPGSVTPWHLQWNG
jgi:hypothetical protein